MKYCSSCGAKLEDKSVFCYVCGEQCVGTTLQKTVPTNNHTEVQIKREDTINTKKYLYYAKTMEARKFDLMRLNQLLMNKIAQLREEIIPEPKPKQYYLKTNFFIYFIFIEIAAFLIGYIYFFDDNIFLKVVAFISFMWVLTGSGWRILLGSLAISAAICCVLNIFPMISKMANNAKIRSYNINTANKAHETYQKNLRKAVLLEAEAKEVKQRISEVSGMLLKLYSTNTLHPKYRNFVAVTTIYEYFDTRRCSCLEGVEGAYNIYEYELRMNCIIDRIDIVITELNEIRQNQQELYRLINDGLGYMQNIYDQSCRLADNLQAIQLSAVNTEYNTKIARENSDFWLYYAAFTK